MALGVPEHFQKSSVRLLWPIGSLRAEAVTDDAAWAFQHARQRMGRLPNLSRSTLTCRSLHLQIKLSPLMKCNLALTPVGRSHVLIRPLVSAALNI